ncbi:hypothetical protein NPX13_g1078 [Xylaria arbuscula]|uniref:Carrier domain-containing protein n=1 Tax=Xylaria arbuscula TaxID=114810 RepID=A0A9W8NMQ6_9PEZI|nr:hypothetical protein NPX13_g1078 [Xylaria arbuscula]
MTPKEIGSTVDHILLRLCAEVLLIPEDKIGPEDSFIGLGGDSFKAIKFKRKCDQLGIRLSLRDILARKTIASISAGQVNVVDKPRRSKKPKKKTHERLGVSSHGNFPLMPNDYAWDLILEAIGFQGTSWNTETLELVENVYPCSEMQDSIYVARETMGNQLYRIHELFELGPRMTLDKLESAWLSIIDLHESLRTIFVPTTDVGSSRLLDAVVLRSRQHNVIERTHCRDYDAVVANFEECCLNPPDVQGSPHRLTLYSTDDGRQYCQFDLSHMISDGSSLSSLINTIDAICMLNQGSVLAPVPGYSKVVKYNQSVKSSDESLDYWRSYVDGINPCIFPSLSTRSRLAEQTLSERYEVVELPLRRHKELSEFCARMEITMSTAFQAAWAMLLRAYTGNEEVCFAFTSSGRDIPVDEVEKICGPLVNLLVRRVSLLENTNIRGMIDSIQEDYVNSLQHQTVQFRRVQQLFKTTEKMFNTILTVQYAPLLVDESEDMPLRRITSFNATEFLSIHATYSDTIVKTKLTYPAKLLSKVTAKRVMNTFLSIIDTILDTTDANASVSQLGLISSSDLQQTIEWNEETLKETDQFPPDTTVHGLIEVATIRAPNAPAIYFSGESLTYDDLNTMATVLALRIIRSSSGKQSFIPLVFEKSPLYSVALLAVLKSGKAFVPIDISNPPERMRQLFEQLGITQDSGLVICSERMSDQLQSLCHKVLTPSITSLRAEINEVQNQDSSVVFPAVQASNTAYIIFTSGSTGSPKGVAVSHGAYAHAARNHASGIQISASSRVLQFASYAFDMSMEDHLTSLIVGACLCVPTETERDTALVDFINTSGANWVHITPSMMVMIPPASVTELKTVVLGGEPMTADNVAEWAIEGRRLVQVYGPSECSVTSTINPDVSKLRDPTNIGRTFAGCATWITDVNNPNALVPIGAIGELLMEGPILAEGYLGLIAATESAFIQNIVWRLGKRLYRTGDLVQYDEVGDIHFVGRADSRVKIRGQRIECGEIESQLMTRSTIRHAVVVVPKFGPGQDRLVAVMSQRPGESVTHSEPTSDDIQLEDIQAAKTKETPKGLYEWLTDRLPAYMIPDLFIIVRDVPMNSSRKLDRKKVARYLESMSQEQYRTLFSRMDDTSEDRPGNELERSIRRTWCRVLNVPESAVGWHTSWFFSGGDSISAMMLSGELRKESIKIPAADILRLRNIERIAVHIQGIVFNSQDAKFQNIDFGKTNVEVSWDLSPMQQLSFQFHPDGDHFDQQTMVVDTSLTISDDIITAALDAIINAHPMLLVNFSREPSAGAQGWRQRVTSATSSRPASVIRFHQNAGTEFMLKSIYETRSRVDLVKGPMTGVDVFRSSSSTTISISIHHLVVDMVSWRIIFQELEDFVSGKRVIQPEPISFQSWCQVQKIYAQSIQPSRVLPEGDLEINIGYWSMDQHSNCFGDAITTTFDIGSSSTSDLLNVCNMLEYSVVDVLCAAIMTSFSRTFQHRSLPVIFIEGHGRESPSDGIDLSRTVGWFTTFVPVAVNVGHDGEVSELEALEQIIKFKEATPSKGLDYFTYRFLSGEGSDKYRESHAPAEIVVNFLGTYQQFERTSSTFRRSNDPELISGISAMRREQRKASERYSLISIVAVIKSGSLSVEVEWNRHMRFQDELTSWSLKIKDNLSLLIRDLSRVSSSLAIAPAPRDNFIHFGVNKENTLNKVMALGVTPHEIESMYPCSPMQEGLMASLLRDSDKSSAYNQTFLLKITPASDNVVRSEQLIKAWQQTVQNYATLRTIFVESDVGRYSQVVLRQIDPIVQIKDGLSVEYLRNTLFDMENQSLKHPLEGAPLHRVVVCKANDESMYMLFTKSHLLTDGMSTQILIQNLARGCSGIDTFDKPNNHYLDYIRFVTNEDSVVSRSYWANYLRGTGTCNFPRLCYVRDIAGTAVSHSSVSLQIHAVEAAVKQLFRAHDLTVPSLFQLAWAIVLSAYLNSEDILFGLLASGRDLPVEGIQHAVGPVASMLPMKIHLRSDMKAIEAAKALQADYIEHLGRQTLSLSQILHAARDRNQTPSFNTILNIQKTEGVSNHPDTETAQIEFVKSIDTTEYGLAMTVVDRRNIYELSLEYENGLISSQIADAIICAFAAAVEGVIANPECLVGDIDLIGDKGKQQICKWDINEFQTKAECVHRLFRTTALSMPDKQAIHSWDGILAYNELELLTNKLARRLLDLSVQPEEIIPLCFEKSLWGIVAMLGVMKAGATFVHIDPSSPISRKKQIIKITSSRLALASVNNRELMESLVPHTLTISQSTLAENSEMERLIASTILESHATPSSALYIIFTSGSTGEPKGVVVEHQNFCSAMAANSEWLQILPSSRILQFSSFVFDACMEEILTALVAGACVCVPSDDDRMSPERLTSFIQEAGVNWAALTPSFLQTLNPDDVVPPLNFLTVHAEAMNASLTRLWSTRVHLRPSYGPTECTVTSTVGAAFDEFSDPSSIGWPVGCHGRICDPTKLERLKPIGAIGELVLEGPILARGYFNRPTETEKAFPIIEDWFDGRAKRVYRTGDLVRYADDGSLRILGRRDAQIKVRGQRVELGEIQGQLDLSPEIHHSLVIQPKSGVLGSRLVAVLSVAQLQRTTRSVASRDRTIRLINDPEIANRHDHSSISEILHQIRSFVSARLPSYMVPDTWCVVEDIPTLASFKLDRKLVNSWLETMDEKTVLLSRKLMSSSRRSSPGTFDTEAETLVRSAWAHVLAIPGDIIDVDDHFIALGGDSISAMNVSRFLSQAGSPVKTQDVLKSNSIRELALALEYRETRDSFTDVTTSSLYKLPWKPYLYNLLAEIKGHGFSGEDLDPQRLLGAWKATVMRHPILRTAIPHTKAGTAAYQFVLDGSTVSCEVFNIGDEEEALKASKEKAEHIKRNLSSISLMPPLWLDLYVTSTKQVYMHLLMGHMLIDHVSLAHVLYDWDVLYRGVSSLLTEAGGLPAFATYIDDVESRAPLTSTDFWVRKLRGIEPTILGPTPGILDSGAKLAVGADAMSAVKFKIPIDADMDRYCRNMRVTVSNLLQFAWGVLLSAYTGRTDVCFGHLASDRDIHIPKADEIVGPMLTVLVTRVVLEGQVEGVIRKLQADNTDSMAHKVFDLSTIEQELGLQLPQSSLFNTLVNYRKVKRLGPRPVMKLRSILKQDPHEVSHEIPSGNNAGITYPELHHCLHITLQQQIILSFNEVPDAAVLDGALTFYESVHSARGVQKMVDAYVAALTLVVSGECRAADELVSRVTSVVSV